MTSSTRVRSRSRTRRRPSFDGIDLFSDQDALVEAERLLLELADYVYAHTSLKPISKTLFLISRCLTVVKTTGPISTAMDLVAEYQALKSSLNGAALADDFAFDAVVRECNADIPLVMEAVNKVCALTAKTDSLGLVFNTLLRGKFEGGEGMGTFLTPEEVVIPMVDMLFKVVDEAVLSSRSHNLFGDICGGTGRFVYAIARRLEEMHFTTRQISRSARLFDQSSMAVDLGRINFLCEGLTPQFEQVNDSLVAQQVSDLKGRFVMLATNPPFGSSKYRWNAALTGSIHPEVLRAIGFNRLGDSADPSELFFFRNLDLLTTGGGLAIVMPDGVIHANGFREAITSYESANDVRIDIPVIVSLPASTFALGGTVAKTSFLIVQKNEKGTRDKPLYVAVASHVGFLKRGKKRADDPNGNELIAIRNEFGSKSPAKFGGVVDGWRNQSTLMPARLLHASGNESKLKTSPLVDLVSMPRDFAMKAKGDDICNYHISILDVDNTGLVDIVAATKNDPVSKGIACQPLDILISCLNPKIWRVAVIPNLPGNWTCSPEFAVLRPNKPEDAWKISLGLHHPTVISAVQAMAKGTSSSRQRVPKESLPAINVPAIRNGRRLENYVQWRTSYYQHRLLESRAYEELHKGAIRFTW